MNRRKWVGVGAALLAVGCGQAGTNENVGKDEQRITAPTQVNGFALLSSGRITLRDRARVVGGHIGVAAGFGDSVTAGADAVVALGRSTLGQRIVLRERSSAGDLFANSVSAPLATYTSLSPFAAPPAHPPIIAFAAGTTPITVSTPMTLAAGNFGVVTVNSTLTLSGGLYQVQNLVLDNNAIVQAAAPSVIRVAGRVTGGHNVRLTPTGSQGAGALRLMVAGANDANGGVVLGNDARLTALTVSVASFQAGDRLIGSGAVAARNLTLGFDARLTFATGFECNADAACNDGNPCTTDSCVDAKCIHPAVSNGTPCPDEGNECTTDVCSSGTCTHPARPDGTACTADASLCTRDECASGQCSHPPLPNGTLCPDDGNECTSDSCAGGACVHPPVADGTACTEDGSECTADQCSLGVCAHAPDPDGSSCADDGNECTADACSGGGCSHSPVASGTACTSDDNPCTTDTCEDGTCAHTLIPGGACSAANDVVPFFDCVAPLGGGRYRALFGYENGSGEVVRVRVGEGNAFSPAPIARGQPEQFSVGTVDPSFAVEFTGPSVTWSLGGRTAVATANGPTCSTAACAPACPPGDQCVDGTCVSSCGDGTCSGENCATCPSDCNCSEAPRLRPGEVPSELAPSVRAQIQPDVVTNAFSALPAPVYGTSYSQAGALWFASGASAPGVLAGTTIPVGTGPFTFQVTALDFTGDEGLCGTVDPYVKNLTIDGTNVGNVNSGTVQVSRTLAGVRVQLEVKDEDGGLCFGEETLMGFDQIIDNYQGGEDCVSNSNGTLCWKATGAANPRVCFEWNAAYADSGPWEGIDTEDFLRTKGIQSIPASRARLDAVIQRDGADVYTFGGFLDHFGCIAPELRPNREHWAPGAAIVATFNLTAQFCLDPDDTGCPLDTSTSPPTYTGANIDVRPLDPATGVAALGPASICSVLTTDPSLVTNPNCKINLIDWTDPPPTEIQSPNIEQNSSTRVAGVVSHMLWREMGTDGELGIRLGMIDRRFDSDPALRGHMTFKVDEPCCTDDDGDSFHCLDTRVTKRTSCARLNAILLAPDGATLSSTHFKYVLAHEFGHYIQGTAQGLLDQTYGSGAGLAGQPALCTCALVPTDDNLHCLQSLEEPNAAEGEGFAQYFAARVFNDETHHSCTFVYYKNFGDTVCRPGVSDCVTDPATGLILNPPPVPLSCVEVVRWRNQKCANFGADFLTFGTEYDWLQFLYGIGENAAPDTRWSMSNVFDAYITACGTNYTPDLYASCEEKRVSWAGNNDPMAFAYSLVGGAQGLVTGGYRSQAAADRFRQVGDEFGVSNLP
jgi:hypothetical protein